MYLKIISCSSFLLLDLGFLKDLNKIHMNKKKKKKIHNIKIG